MLTVGDFQTVNAQSANDARPLIIRCAGVVQKAASARAVFLIHCAHEVGQGFRDLLVFFGKWHIGVMVISKRMIGGLKAKLDALLKGFCIGFAHASSAHARILAFGGL